MSKLLLSRSTLALSFVIVFIVLLSHSVSLQGAAAPSADFDGSGVVDITDFLLFTSVFGTREGQEQYEAKYDLNSDGEIGITDFLIFVNSFGKKVEQTVNSEPRFTFVSPAIRSFDDSTSAGQDIGNPISATDPDGDSLTYRLSGPDANSFTIVPSSGQLQTKAGVTYNYKTKPVYSVIVGAADSRGGTDAVTVRIAVLSPNLSGTYQNFVRAKENGTEPVLPDFSYSGYHYFNKPVPDVTHPIFDVTTYGAIPNDNISDQPAIKAAIAAAESNGSGIVFFPPGVFLVNTDTDKNSEGKNESIYIRSSNIVLRGSGSRQGGTIIRQVNHLPPTNPDQLWTSPFMFYFKPNDIRYRTLTKITESAERETFWITVADASKLKVGQRIRIYMKSTQAIKEFLAPRSPEPNWSKLLSEGITIDEEHSIAEIQGNRIRFNEPLHTRVNHAHGWVVRSYPYIEEVGVEDISFHGSFQESFIHHKSALHDGGWSLLSFRFCVNSWIRRVSFVHTNFALEILRSTAMSVYQVTVAGNKGHFSIKIQDCYGVWAGLSEDIAGQAPYSTVPLIDGPNSTRAIPGQQHGVSMSHNTGGNVVHRFDMTADQPVDIHRTDPCYANLFDCVNHGRLSGSSGAGVYPNHLRHLVFWNFNHGGEDTHYDFWQRNLRFVNPIIVGFHGNPATFNKNVLEVLESNGSPVDPESLFEAQIELRLGAVPAWYNNLHTEWQTLRDMPLSNSTPIARGTIPMQTLTTGTDWTIDLSSYFFDPDNDVLTYSALSSDVGVATVSVEGSVVTITMVASGRAAITVTVSDGSSSTVQTIEVRNTGLPVAQGAIPMLDLTVGTDRTVDVSGYFSDPDGDKLTYSALSSDAGIATVSVVDAVVTISPVLSGRATITVTASDGHSSIEQTFTITVVAPPSANSKIYWSDNGTDKIQRANIDGSNVEDLVTRPTLSAPVGIALDISGGKMYWIDETTDKIQRSNLDGSSIEDLITTGLDLPSGIALDISSSKMYWMDRGIDKIQRANIDGSNVEDLVTGLTAPRGIALDISGGKMYWVDNVTDKIQRANLNGTGVEDLVTGVTDPRGIALDISGGKMYWVDNGADKIQRANLNGTGVEDLVTGVTDPRGIALDISGGKMYWVDNGADKIQRANLNGTGVEDLVT
ncbi:MAG: DUF4955 domain-containing protein, partial [Candidatus Poribacteria bacterium]|nr:DUF4955 domain-containing protein [Candidatus Poribacteria bacterium]